MYAVNAKDGAMRWKHEPGDFESTLPYSVEVIYSVMHYVLRFHKRKFPRIELVLFKHFVNLMYESCSQN